MHVKGKKFREVAACEPNEVASQFSNVDQVLLTASQLLAALFSGFHSFLLEKCTQSLLFLMACGAVIKIPEAFQGLRQFAERQDSSSSQEHLTYFFIVG
jgi:hypothetical protein